MSPARKLVVYGALALMSISGTVLANYFVLVWLRDAIVTRTVAASCLDEGPNPSPEEVKDWRADVRRSAADVRQAFSEGRVEQGLAQVAATRKRIRKVGSATGAGGLYLAGVATAAQRDFDAAIETALAAKAVPASALARLDAMYADALARPHELEPRIAAHLDLIDACVRTFDADHGILRWFNLFSGDGIAQVAKARADWTTHRAMRMADDAHYIVQQMMPQVIQAQNLLASATAVRKTVRARIAQQRS